MIHDIKFDPKEHCYSINGVKLRSVTSLVKSVTPEFDKERVSQHLSQKRGVPSQQIIEEWDLKSQEAIERGNMLHSYIYDSFFSDVDVILHEMRIKTPEMIAFDKAWGELVKKFNASMVKHEFVVGCPELKIAGTVDAMINVNVIGSSMKCLVDWKTGTFKTTNRFAKLLPPFDDLDDCELNRYSIQLSMYRILVEKNYPDDVYGNAYLVHLMQNETYAFYKCIDLRSRIITWLGGMA